MKMELIKNCLQQFWMRVAAFIASKKLEGSFYISFYRIMGYGKILESGVNVYKLILKIKLQKASSG